jgi:DNA polymerase III delta prime subunit
VVRGIAHSAAPLEAQVESPAWLRTEQTVQHRRAVAAILNHRGVLLADPPGSGKTWIALATARSFGGNAPVAVVAPAILREQWTAVAERTAQAVSFVSHESVSRGRLPDDRTGFVVVDESHRFRTPATRRYRRLAPWLVGRRGMLLSATPVVNRLDDLAHQLLLFLRDDALLGRGCASLKAALTSKTPPFSLGEVVIRRAGVEGLPSLLRRDIRSQPGPGFSDLLHGISRLRLSRDPGVAALLRLALYRALASSPAALAGALRRHLRILDHADSAHASGKSVCRATLRRLVGAEPDQLLMWGVITDPGEALDLEVGDRPGLEGMLQAARRTSSEPGCAGPIRELRRVLSDRAPAVVFTNSRDTLAWLRHALSELAPGWVTGDEAGIGRTRMPRGAVLRWFGPGTSPPAGMRIPHLLLATDVAAEGLDLQRTRRVVHFDLPWTDVRLEQRAGRSRRIGASAGTVEIVTFLPPRRLERCIRQIERIREKRALRSRVGLDDRAPWLFGWRSDLAAWAGREAAAGGHVVVTGTDAGWLVGISFAAQGSVLPPASLLWFGDDGSETDKPEQTVPRLLRAATAPPGSASLDWFRLLPRLTHRVRQLLSESAGAVWQLAPARGMERTVLHRLERMARDAAVRRDREQFQRLEPVLEAIGGGLSAGESAIVERAAELQGDAFLHCLRSLPGRPPHRPPQPVTTGIVRVASFPV